MALSFICPPPLTPISANPRNLPIRLHEGTAFKLTSNGQDGGQRVHRYRELSKGLSKVSCHVANEAMN